MPPKTRLKRKPEPHIDAPITRKRSKLSNLTNFKSPLKRTNTTNANDKIPSHFLPVVSLERLASSASTQIPEEVLATQSGEFVLTQIPSIEVEKKTDGGVSMMRSIKKVLENNFKDVSDRLQLQSVPQCLFDLSSCHRNHSKKVDVEEAGSESQYLAKNFLAEERHTQFILYVRNSMCGRKEFPGVAVVKGILEMILVS
jgi:hypothetical protein